MNRLWRKDGNFKQTKEQFCKYYYPISHILSLEGDLDPIRQSGCTHDEMAQFMEILA
jgi:hypothetical protein